MFIVAGYPRSGNTWLQYAVSTATKEGCEKTHWFTKNIPGNHWIFPLRNYKESITRHSQHSNIKRSEIKDFILNQMKGTPCRKNGPTDYIDLLRCFDNFKGLKKIIYYEDMIENPTTIFCELFSFLGHDGSVFIKELDFHKKNSIKQYIPKSATGGTKKIHHSCLLDEKEKQDIDNMVSLNFPILFNKYLKRYKG